MQSLQSNPDLYVISFRKHNKSQQMAQSLYYREIGANKYEGPYCYPGSNEYRLDVTYQDYLLIYSEYLKSVLSGGSGEPRRLAKPHEYLLENQTRFGLKFQHYWRSICNLLPESQIRINTIIFVKGKY